MKKLLAITLTLVMLLGALSTVTLSVNAADFTVTDDGWDGTTATEPEGSGTEEDPYLISSAENLYWISKQCGGGGEDTAVVFGDGMYFEQTCDIDLNGKAFKGIGSYYSSAEKLQTFGGNYNGNGYSIKNGTAQNANGASITTDGGCGNSNWGSGIFCMIYGATIENVVLDNVTVIGKGSVGGIVGGAYSPDSATADFNVIRNCVVKSNCEVRGIRNAQITSGAHVYGSNDQEKIGGIIGHGTNITIENCVNEGKVVNADARHQPLMGGIAALLGRAAVVNNCVNKGTLVIDYTNGYANSKKWMHVSGGIVGYMGAESTVNARVKMAGASSISNCYNAGGITIVLPEGDYSATNKYAVGDNDLCWGGIFGTTRGPAGVITISDCHNLVSSFTNFASIKFRNGDVDVGGIAGQLNFSGTNIAVIKNCSSVNVTDRSAYTGTYYHGENVLYCSVHTTTSATEYTDIFDGGNNAVKTAQEIAPAVAAIDELVARNQVYGRDSVNYIGVQKSLTAGDNRVRVLAGVNTTDIKAVGFEATLENGKKADILGYTVYETVTAAGDPVAASTYNAKYFVTMVFNPVATVDGVATPVSGTVTGRFYSINNAGVQVYGSEAFTLVFENGVLTSPSADIQ
ncbi:MAG: hypothetical protein IJ011_08315 [Clostridia bacterium]|nr:hypothetical protein [Clostridia bacterium]